MLFRFASVVASVLVLSGCVHPHLPNTMDMVVYKDSTQVAPSYQFLETPESKSVIVGSYSYAMVNACQPIKRYRIRTNADFTGSMNLLKYRAALMGAKWVTVVNHQEIDRFESTYFTASDQIILKDGTELGSSRYFTSITADLLDCPCSVTSCSGR